MSINSFDLATKITNSFCQIPLLRNHPVIINDVKQEVDKFIDEIYQYLDSNNLTFDELEIHNLDYTNNDLLFIMNDSECIYNIFLKLFCGSIDDYLEKNNNANQEIANYYIDNYANDIQIFILNYFRNYLN